MSIIFFVLCWIPILAATHTKYLYKTEYVEVPVDQFSFTNDKTFKLRYLTNDSYFELKTGPIFFYPGNEGDIKMFSQNSGFMWEAAKQLRAMIVFAEHRYYGTSLPFGNKSLTEPKYFGYLNSQQALADFVDVINHIKLKIKLTNPSKSKESHKNSNPVIAFGGSYGGMLAAWMRMKYPAIIEGCLASSAPIWHFTGMLPSCSSYTEKVTAVFNQSSSKCVDNIRKSWGVIDKMTAKKSGRNWISKRWKLCKPLQTESDGTYLKYVISNIYDAVAMVNYPYENDFLKPVPGNPVSEMCKPLRKTFHSKTKLLRALFEAISVYTNHTGTLKCFDWKNDAFGDVGMAGWNIQACTEMVLPFCSNGKTDMYFPVEWNFKDYAKECFETYHVYPQERLVEKLYGGKSIEAASNIIFSNGDLDPWMVGGVPKSISKTVVAILLQGAAHHLDLRESHPKDPKSVANAKKFYIQIFKKWIQDYYKRHKLE